MGLEQVKKEIIDNATKTADAILVEAKQEAEKIFDETKKTALEERKKADTHTSDLLLTLERREIAAAEFDARKMMLDAKKELIDEAMKQAAQKVMSWNGKKRESVMNTLTEKAKKDLDLAIIAANPKDKTYVKGFSFEEADIQAGMIGRTKDGRVSVDYSVDEMLQTIRSNNLAEIGKVLFE